MAIARVQAAGSGHGGSGGFGAQTATFASAVNAGDLLVCLYWGNSNVGNATCSDNINGAWTALTQRTPVSGSGRRMNWFYKLATASASAGAMTVTITPNANAGNSEWMQIVEYSGVASYDTAVAAYAATTLTPSTVTSGIPTQTGDLVLMGVVCDSESLHTFSANSPLTGLALDGASKTGNEANGSATLVIAEWLGASTTAVAGSVGIGFNDAAGAYIIGFAPSAGSTVTKTQTAIARIVKNLTKTQTAIARIANAKTKTQTAIARVANTRTKTQSAIARIARTPTKTQAATARIANSRTKTQTATANIQTGVPLSKTQSAIARIANARTKTQAATAHITAVVTKTQTATASIIQGHFVTQTAIARISNIRSKTQSATANIGQTATKAQGAVARIATASTKTQTATASIVARRNAYQTATARIANNIYRFQPPVMDELPRTLARPGRDRRFWMHVDRGRRSPRSVLKYADGTYKLIATPSQDQIAQAVAVYMGGHIHVIDVTEAAALTAAGYSVLETVE